MRETIVPSIARGEAIVRAFPGAARELFRKLVLETWKAIGETSLAGILKLMMAEAAHFPELARFYYDEVVARGHRVMASVLERGIESGEFRRVNVDLAVRVALAPILHLAIWKHSLALCTREPLDASQLLETQIDLFLNGIAHA